MTIKVKVKITCMIIGKGIFEKDKIYELEEEFFDEIFFEKVEEDDKMKEEQKGELDNANRNRKTRN